MNEFGRALRLAFYFVVGLVLGGAAIGASAAGFGVVDASGKIIGSYGDSPSFRMPSGWSAAQTGAGVAASGNGGATLSNVYRIGQSGGGPSAVVNLAKSVSAVAISPIARVAARMLGPIALAGLAYDAYMTWNADDGVWEVGEEDPAPIDGYYWRLYAGGVCGYGAQCTWSTALQAARDRCTSTTVSPYYCDLATERVTEVSYYLVQWDVKRLSDGSVYGTHSNRLYTDSVNSDPVGVRPASDADMDTAITSALQANPSSAPQVLQQAIQATGQLPSADPIVSSGPASINGGQITSTSSGPAGISTTTTNTNYSVSYGGPVVTVTENKSVTYTAPDGQTTTTTDQTTPSPDAAAPEPEKALCEEFPDASGCAKLGKMTGDPQTVAEQPVQVNQITPQSIGGSGGACPSDRVMNTSYGTLTFSWLNLCGLAEGVRPVILAMAWLVAGFSFFFGAKRSGV